VESIAFPTVTLAEWRALVEKELAGKPFDKALVHETIEGLRVAPLYAEAPAKRLAQEEHPASFRICARFEAGAPSADLAGELAAGAEALWLPLEGVPGSLKGAPFLVLDADGPGAVAALEQLAARDGGALAGGFALGLDPLARCATGRAPAASLRAEIAALGPAAQRVAERFPEATAVRASTLPYHDAGADAADELAIALSAGVSYLKSMLEAGLTPERAARQIALQVAVGRDTFVELCKVRALRACWRKVLAASDAGSAPPARVHAVCSSRTLTVRDPWVNMLRVTTQVFAGVLGGADLVTPNAFDQAFGSPSALGRRVARNTALVLREESFIGKVSDPAGGSYYFESLTDALAREAWNRFRVLEQEGGVAAALESGRLAARLEAGWRKLVEKVATRRLPLLGVSEFANLEEKLPRHAPPAEARTPNGALPAHRDAAAYEALRLRADAGGPEALLVTLGPFAESRARAGFAANFLAAGGIRSRETTADAKAAIACLCGTDERYAEEAAARARALKKAGCARVILAGRPGANEATLREAGVDGFIFVGCDVVSILSQLLEVKS
jgi:methylmalonyl-CoA mutase